ncbi:hypothetical protein HDU86_007737 [Geranomyces michiganensis]|nr:hypothetical protein HDU86_007737 [Geranomyces michiganensis]
MGDRHPAPNASSVDVVVEPSWDNAENDETLVRAATPQQTELSLKDLILLTIVLTGVQITWTVELAYGNPYLRELNLSPSLSALVWLAGPLSGLLIQPIVGVYSDKCGLKLGKRRPFMIVGGAIVLLSIAMIGYAAEIAQVLTGSMDTKTNENITIMSAVLGFYWLDFSINAVQASCRSLIVDIAPLHQQESANAWGGRMIGVGNVLGYFIGFLDLPKLFPFFGDKQMKVFCWLASIWFASTLAMTCVAVKENQYIPKESEKRRSWYEPLLGIGKALRGLPGPLQAICNVQFFGWMGIFPFLFYSTTWVGEKVLAASPTGSAQDNVEGTRAGSFAMLLYSIVSLATGFFLPMISIRAHSDDDHASDTEDAPPQYENVSTSSSASRRSTAARRSRRKPSMGNLPRFCRRLLGLPAIWSFSFCLFVTLMFSTAIVHTVGPATALIAAVGVTWGIMMWVPFTLLGECINYYAEHPEELAESPLATRPGYENVPNEEEDDEDERNVFERSPTISDLLAGGKQQPGQSANLAAASSTTALIPSSSSSRPRRRRSSTSSSAPSLHAGMVLGIHNIYIVIPQFFATFMCSMVFMLFSRLEQRNKEGTRVATSFGPDGTPVVTEIPLLARNGDMQLNADPHDAVGWVLRLGAVSSIVACVLAFRLKEIKSAGKPGAPRVVVVPGGH